MFLMSRLMSSVHLLLFFKSPFFSGSVQPHNHLAGNIFARPWPGSVLPSVLSEFTLLQVEESWKTFFHMTPKEDDNKKKTNIQSVALHFGLKYLKC